MRRVQFHQRGPADYLAHPCRKGSNPTEDAPAICRLRSSRGRTENTRAAKAAKQASLLLCGSANCLRAVCTTSPEIAQTIPLKPAQNPGLLSRRCARGIGAGICVSGATRYVVRQCTKGYHHATAREAAGRLLNPGRGAGAPCIYRNAADSQQ